jgi:hypothetical protein
MDAQWKLLMTCLTAGDSPRRHCFSKHSIILLSFRASLVFLSCLRCLLSAFCAPTSLHARCGFSIGPPVSALALAEFASHFETPSTPPRSLARGGLALVAGRVGQLPGQLAHLLQPLNLLAQPALLAPSQHSIQYRNGRLGLNS